jgi:outer membrane protein assembly factor BamB
MHARLAIVLLVLLLGKSAPQAEDWPHWRGPLATGVSSETGLPVTWSETDNVAWKSRIRGLGISTPIVWRDRVFVTSQEGRGRVEPGPRLVQGGGAAEAGERPLGSGDAAGASDKAVFLVTAFDRASGKQVWTYELPSEGGLPEVHEKHNMATSSPVSDGERVYAWFGTGQIVALDMNGGLVWKRHLGTEFAPFDISWGHSSSPVLFRDSLVLLCYQPSSSYLVALDARTGKDRWKVDRGKGVTSYSTPLVVETPQRAELIVNSSLGMSGHDAASGALLWHIEETSRFPIPMPVQHGGTIYTSRGYRSGPFMAIRPGGTGNVADSHVVWKVPTGAPYVSSIVHHDGLIYMVGDVGVATVTDAKTGERVWQERVGGVYSASPVAADGKIYLLSEDGQSIVLAAGRPPRVLAKNKLDARQLASPAVSGGRLFIRSDEFLYAIGATR